jgi:hypothetical protein
MQKELLRFFARGWLVVGLCMFALSAQARMQRVDPGEIPDLAPDEGLVLVAVDTDIDLYSVRVRKDGKAFGAGIMNDLKIGRSFRLYVAPAGVYEWREVQLIFGLKYALSEDPEFKFKVEPGKITYPGDLLFRPVTAWRATVAMSNRGLVAIDWLEQHHPVLYTKYPFGYVGRYPDPFPAFYRQARDKYPAANAVSSISLIPPPAPGALPIAVKTLWKEPRILQASLNPAGTLLALHVRDSEEEWGVELVDLKAGKLTKMVKSAMACSMEWSGDDTLLVSVGESTGLKPSQRDPYRHRCSGPSKLYTYQAAERRFRCGFATQSAQPHPVRQLVQGRRPDGSRSRCIQPEDRGRLSSDIAQPNECRHQR